MDDVAKRHSHTMVKLLRLEEAFHFWSQNTVYKTCKVSSVEPATFDQLKLVTNIIQANSHVLALR